VPAYYVLVAVVVLLIPTGLVLANYADLPGALAYYTNYRKTVGSLGMTWSLSVEEQFYVLWPTAIVLLGLRRAKLACLLLLLTAPVFRLLSDFHEWPTYPKFAFESVCDALATGCLLALFRERIWSIDGYRRAMELGLAPVPLVAALLFLAAQPTPLLRDVIGIPAANIGLAIMLDRCMRMPATGIARLLNWRPVVWIGTISYSLYLWQQLFAFGNHLPAWAKIAGIFATASLSYYLIEQPFLAIGRRFRRASPPAEGLAAA
jgi:peptidoglycan/LPS O-acetylase OafA/YrhL